MRAVNKRKIFIILLLLLSNLSFICSASVFQVDVENGFYPVPAYVHCYYYFMDATKASVSTACGKWDSAGSGNVVYSVTPFHYNTIPFDPNSENEFTRSYAGESYLAGFVPTDKQVIDGVTVTIYEGDIDFNIDLPLGDASLYSNLYDIQTLALHELGHFLGLGHSTESTAVMYYGGLGLGELHRTLTQYDKDGLAAIY